MNGSDFIVLSSECPAVRIPSGDPVLLPAGSEVQITQSLGDTYTVYCKAGELVRIQGRYAGALGIEAPTHDAAEEVHAPFEGDVDQDLIWDQMRTCYDPEIPVNIVDLGLVYDCSVTPLERKGENRVDVKMTLTAAGCGMGPVIAGDVDAKVRSVPGATDVHVEIVWDPPWTQDMMSDAAKLQLGML